MKHWIALLTVALAAGLLAACGDDSEGGGGETSASAGFEIVGTWEGELRYRFRGGGVESEGTLTRQG